MQKLPHIYHTKSQLKKNAKVKLSSDATVDIISGAPPEFGGEAGLWSPETLLTAAVADCYVLSFSAVARASRFEWEGIECSVEGTLDRTEGQLKFTHFKIQARLSVNNEADHILAEKLMHKAENNCLITNSMTAKTTLSTHIKPL